MISKKLLHNYEIRNDIIEVTPVSIIDEDWEFIDKLGHLHKWHDGKLSTLKAIIDSPATDEYPVESHMVCKLCGEELAPGYKPPEYREWKIVRKHYYIDGAETNKEEFEKRWEENQKKQ